ncbi:MAG TPA: NAD-glutamate dehydrogenase [Xanthobacteraceae bacterium]|nr:NAD-glutamate dehydrogenase [Xanthobacteraceae bacterium]
MHDKPHDKTSKVLPVADDGGERARDLIKAAGALLPAPIPPELTERLFGRAAPEDVLAYTAGDLALLTRQAWGLLAERKPGEVKMRLQAPRGGNHTGAISVLEIINDDKPFLLDSTMGALAALGISVRLVAHPVLGVARGADGRITRLDPTGARESFIHIHLDRIENEERKAKILSAVGDTLTEVNLAVADWRPMMDRVAAITAELKANPPPLPQEEVAEAIAFLEWLVDQNFTFLGVREDAYDEASGVLAEEPASVLGILRHRASEVMTSGGERLDVPAAGREFLKEPQALVIIKTNQEARVHRRVTMDLVGVKRYDKSGRVVGIFRIVGLFTSTAYTRSTRSIPYLRRKAAAVIARAGFDPSSHSGKALAVVLEQYPRDELFAIDTETLLRFGLLILQLDERPRVRVLARRDRFDRFTSVLVYVPRDRFDSAIREQIGAFLGDAYRGTIASFAPFFPEGPLVRVHFIVARGRDPMPEPSRAELEGGVADIVRTWSDALADALAEACDPAKASALLARYQDAFSQAYREAFSPLDAVTDIRTIDTLTPERPLAVDFYQRVWEDGSSLGLKVWSHGRPIPLSERVPVLEHMGFRVVDESTYHAQSFGRDAPDFWLHDMALTLVGGGKLDLASLKSHLETCFIMVMRGFAENDGFNGLVLAGQLPWRDIALLRAIARYLRQIRVPYSQDYLWATLVRHGAIAAKLAALFHARFDPRLGATGGARAEREAALAAEIDAALEKVDSLDEDRIIRHFVNIVQAATRTNFYQLGADGRVKAEIACKLDSHRVDGMPLPRPLCEIFIYSPRLEAVHLRFGKVARGGIRWSDRPQDFRTEVLSLVKAQQVKNAVIVPVGAKGGYVPKRIPAGASRDAIAAEGVATYRIFMSTMLDITDNFGADGKLVPPVDTVRHDGDDPYLVVAADKGTATFSDIANGIASEHGFWLDDAFASGGSAGYDHKKMGITARGAWESVKRHFREMDIDIGKTPFTCVGIGDMSGDVFGNGMLRERTTKLLAAFDHRDIFIDPSPDPEKSFVERQRLFDLPRSSWQDYDKSLISNGGGVYSRAHKEIDLSPQAQAALGFSQAKATPQEVMRAILEAPVDLLFFGGIGTYVRATTEGDEAAGDRANDAIRITGADLRCKVIGEGGNLGMTQRGRIEAARRKIRLNTDAIDNSAGVNTSDVEVNLKIALSRPMRDGRITREGRNTLLASLTDDVAKLVLRNNYQQTLALSLAERRGLEDLGFQQRMMQILESRHLLDRAVEFLPDDVELTERRRRSEPLTRPELSVLLAYAKLSLNDDLLASSVPDDPYLGRELNRYFPPAVAEKYPDALTHHRLRREIIATQLANSMINRGGPTLVVRIADETGAPPSRIAAAFAAVRNSYDLIGLNTDIEALDNEIPGKLQLDLFTAVQDLILDRLVWFLRSVDLSRGLAAVIDHYHAGIAIVAAVLDGVLTEAALTTRRARAAELTTAGVPAAVAGRIADLPWLIPAADIVLVADSSKKAVADVAATYFAAGAYFQVDRIAAAARGIPVADYFDRLALDRALAAIGTAECRITGEMMANGAAGAGAVDQWVAARRDDVERVRMAVHEIAASGLTLSKLSVAASMLGDLAK